MPPIVTHQAFIWCLYILTGIVTFYALVGILVKLFDCVELIMLDWRMKGKYLNSGDIALNNNPDVGNDSNNCTVLALSHAFGLKYNVAAITAGALFNREFGEGAKTMIYYNKLNSLCRNETPINGRVVSEVGYRPRNEKGRQYTVGEFLEKVDGLYILSIDGHTMVKNGRVLIDPVHYYNTFREPLEFYAKIDDHLVN